MTIEKTYTITRKDLYDLFGRLAESYRVIVPYADGTKLTFADFDQKKEDAIELGSIRQSQPLKSFITVAREKVFDGARQVAKPRVIAGVKGCDLTSLSLQDFVFLRNEPVDSFYDENRRNTVLIGVDCTTARETCFCVAMDGAPYPRAHFDLSLAPMDDYFLVEIGTDRGRDIVMGFKLFFKDALPGDVKRRQSEREGVTRRIRDFIAKRGTPDTAAVKGKVAEHYNLAGFWQDMASTCVECGACNLVCPTCHCFLLYDEKARLREGREGAAAGGPGSARRYRSWDACLYKSFARVAGDHNPRKHLHERLRNRFDKKFEYFPQVMQWYACTGCGRCIEACPGDIDIREVLKGLVKGIAWNKPPHD